MTSPKIKTNKIKCIHCQDIIESIHCHDFNFCKCGCVAVDGGKAYLKRCFKNDNNDYIDLSEVEDDNTPSSSSDS